MKAGTLEAELLCQRILIEDIQTSLKEMRSELRSLRERCNVEGIGLGRSATNGTIAVGPVEAQQRTLWIAPDITVINGKIF
jgi:hypothetical protein